MKDFKNGVGYYMMAELNIKIGFPENETVCGYCPFIKEEYGLKRHRCILTDEMLYSMETRGRRCPLIFTGEIEERKEKEE